MMARPIEWGERVEKVRERLRKGVESGWEREWDKGLRKEISSRAGEKSTITNDWIGWDKYGSLNVDEMKTQNDVDTDTEVEEGHR